MVGAQRSVIKTIKPGLHPHSNAKEGLHRSFFEQNEQTAIGKQLACVAGEHLNFRHAAAALGVSLSSVSTRVKMLEEYLGVLLFERHARGV